jgi:hypothetical protein
VTGELRKLHNEVPFRVKDAQYLSKRTDSCLNHGICAVTFVEGGGVLLRCLSAGVQRSLLLEGGGPGSPL